jgi:hypothetical protein
MHTTISKVENSAHNLYGDDVASLGWYENKFKIARSFGAAHLPCFGCVFMLPTTI